MIRKLVFVTGVALVVAFSSCTTPSAKQSYVDLNRLYNEFEYRKILESQLKKSLSVEQQRLDSLGLEIETFERKAQSVQITESQAQSYYSLKSRFNDHQHDFNEMEQELVEQYDAKLWSQLNQYVKDYCSANEVDFLFGANGSGVIMYADSSLDVTDNLIEYANRRFQDQ